MKINIFRFKLSLMKVREKYEYIFKNENYVINVYIYNLYSIIIYYNTLFIYLDFGTHTLSKHNVLLWFLFSNGFLII